MKLDFESFGLRLKNGLCIMHMNDGSLKMMG